MQSAGAMNEPGTLPRQFVANGAPVHPDFMSDHAPGRTGPGGSAVMLQVSTPAGAGRAIASSAPSRLSEP
jgi:hypothetical protein